ncbi:hypothetical protein BDK51DRAFT_43862 [Blyttiomyces helicus]|uniref:Uncharacterized protein n=1 Tax=Blyttiomyces helicus TaxID=388810 RepID=A0A4P9WCP0_9FUNG|nr:hypothetical protein BDK51DRAFT_43862 [Blyttiomyces helicus]|eukprot:RKO88988.1 hypothetical protein BDK51DRAFT_43862 [Blyttiomyces helicus]
MTTLGNTNQIRLYASNGSASTSGAMRALSTQDSVSGPGNGALQVSGGIFVGMTTNVAGGLIVGSGNFGSMLTLNAASPVNVDLTQALVTTDNGTVDPGVSIDFSIGSHAAGAFCFVEAGIFRGEKGDARGLLTQNCTNVAYSKNGNVFIIFADPGDPVYISTDSSYEWTPFLNDGAQRVWGEAVVPNLIHQSQYPQLKMQQVPLAVDQA